MGQGIALQPALHASEGMQAALNGTIAKPTAQAVSRKQLNKMLNEVGHHELLAACSDLCVGTPHQRCNIGA